jgi:hypothetical protein
MKSGTGGTPNLLDRECYLFPTSSLTNVLLAAPVWPVSVLVIA